MRERLQLSYPKVVSEMGSTSKDSDNHGICRKVFKFKYL